MTQALIAVVISTIILVLDAWLLIYVRHHYKYLLSKVSVIAIAFLACFIAWLGIIFNPQFYGTFNSGEICSSSGCQNIITTTEVPEFVNGIFICISNTIKMFALSISEGDFPSYFIATFSGSNYSAIKALVFIDEAFAFLFISYVIITVAVRSLVGKLLNFNNYFKGLGQNRYVNYIFTDLPYPELNDFISYCQGKHDKVIVVLTQTSQLTQEGTELKSALLAKFIQVKIGTITGQFFGTLIFWHPRSTKIRIYGCFKSDNTSLLFADEALRYCRACSNKKPRSIAFYVNHQDPDLEKKYNYGSDSHGLIRFFSEYEWTATKFVFQEPLNRLYASKYLNPYVSKGEIDNDLPYQVELIGFGGINKAILKRMISAYVTPTDNQDKIIYHIVSLDKEKADVSFLAGFPAIEDNAYRDKEKYLPQADRLCLSADCMDLTDEDQLKKYAQNIQNSIIERGRQVLIVVAAGSSETNILIATKLRDLFKKWDFIKRRTTTTGSNKQDEHYLMRGQNFKSVIIAPYIKERRIFSPDFAAFEDEYQLVFNETNNIKEIEKAIEKHRLYVFEPKTNFVTSGFTLPKKVFHSMESNPNKELNHTAEKQNTTQQSSENKTDQGHKWVENDFKDFRHFVYRYETVPIIAFGRGGYFVDDYEDHLLQLAKRANLIYSCSFYKKKEENDYHLEMDRVGPFGFFQTDSIDKEWAGISLPTDRASNFSHVAHLPEQLAVFGYRIEVAPIPNKLNQKYCRQVTINTLKALLDIKRKLSPNVANDGPKEIAGDSDLVSYPSKSVKQSSSKSSPYLVKNNDEKVSQLTEDEYLVLIRNELLKAWPQKDKKCDGEGFDFGNPNYSNKIKKAIDSSYDKLSADLHELYNATYCYIKRPYQERLANLEHNRWYNFQAGEKVIPMPVDLFDIHRMKNVTMPITKSYLKDIHFCMTTNSGLRELRGILLTNILYDPKLISYPDQKSFDEEFMNKQMKSIYETTFWFDVFTINHLSAMLAYTNGKGKDIEDIMKELNEETNIPEDKDIEEMLKEFEKKDIVFDFALTKLPPNTP